MRAPSARRLSVERAAVSGVAGALLALLARPGIQGAGSPAWLAWALAAGLGVAAVALALRRLPGSLDGRLRARPVSSIAWGLLSLAALALVARLGAFMVDPWAKQHAIPGFAAHHSCLTAYAYAAAYARQRADNVYAAERYDDPAPARPGPVEIAPFAEVDPFQYPPPFLLAADAALRAGGGFGGMRGVWCALNALLLAGALMALARAQAPERRMTVALASVAVFASIPTLFTLQIGNFHLGTVALAILGMVALERGHRAASGGLLAFAIWSKLFPGVLVLYLAAQRRWRDLAWTAAMGALLLGATLAAYGTAPFIAFAEYQVPRLASGEAFTKLLADPVAFAANQSPQAFAAKLGMLGVPGMGGLARPFSLAVAVSVAAAAVLAGARGRRDARCWLALLNLAALLSPFAPVGYVSIGSLCLLLTLWPEARGAPGRVVGLVALWLGVSSVVPLPSPIATAGASLVAQLLAYGLNAWALARPPPQPQPVPAPALA